MSISAPVITIAGNTDLSEELVDLRIRHDLNMTSVCTIRASDPDRAYAETYLGKIGQVAKVSLDDVVCFEGIIIEVGTEQVPRGTATLLVRCMDKSFQLSHQSAYRSFENQTYADAVGQLVTDAGLAGKELASELSSFAPPYIIQEGTSLAFLEDVCLRTGTRWHVRENKLHVRSTTKVTHDLIAEDDGAENSPKLVVQALNAGYSAAPHAKDVEVRAWDHATSAEVLSTVTWPSAPGTNGLAKLAEAKAKAVVTKPLHLPAAAANSADEATAIGTGVAKRMASEATRISGTLVDAGPKLMVDDAVKITGFGKVDGTYTLTRVEHNYAQRRTWQTTFHAGYRPPSVLGAAGGPGSEVAMRRNQIDIGKVSDIADEAGPTRVKVSYPTRHGELVSNWARIMGVGAGPTRGVHWVPEVGDEVAIGYLGGDPRQPVVLGGLWTADDASAPRKSADAVKDGKVELRSIASRLGSSIEFSDGASDETKHVKLGVTTDAMPFLRLGVDRGDIELAEGKPLLIKVGSTTIEIDDSGNVVVKGKEITLTAENDVTITGKKVTIKGDNGVDLDGGGSKTKLASGSAELSSSGSTKVKGSTVALN